MNDAYYVIAKKWSDGKKDIVKYIVGVCYRYIDAELLRNAYNEHYHANAYIVSVEKSLDFMVEA